MAIMNVIEKRDFIHSHLHQADERVVNEFYEVLRKSEVLKSKLESRAEKSEGDISAGRVFFKAEVEQRTLNVGR